MGLQQGLHHVQARTGENFPVASWLLPEAARADIFAFYDFARGADNIADHPDMTSQEKLEALTALETSLHKGHANTLPPWAKGYAKLVSSAALSPLHGRDLLIAFKQDAETSRYQRYEDVLDYCRYSAAPVGRAVLELCGETKADTAKTDALCMLLQLINHLQDIKTDYQQLDRIYLPQNLMTHYQLSETDLAADSYSPALRALLDDMLEKMQALLLQSQHGWDNISSFRLRLEVAWIWQIAACLLEALKRHDPIAGPVTISRTTALFCLLPALREAL